MYPIIISRERLSHRAVCMCFQHNSPSLLTTLQALIYALVYIRMKLPASLPCTYGVIGNTFWGCRLGSLSNCFVTGVHLPFVVPCGVSVPIREIELVRSLDYLGHSVGFWATLEESGWMVSWKRFCISPYGLGSMFQDLHKWFCFNNVLLKHEMLFVEIVENSNEQNI